MTVEVRRMRPLLGTFVEIRAAGERHDVEAGIAAAFVAIERVQRLMSFHDPASDVSRLNTAPRGQVLRIDEETHTVLRAAHAVSDLSEGLFDIVTAAPLVRHGFLPRPQSRDVYTDREDGSAQCLPSEPEHASYRDLELLSGNRVCWCRKGLIDLGGIAKGYAVDRAIEALQTCGAERGIVNAGGDLRCFGAREPIHLRVPDEPASVVPIGELEGAALATSADYFSGYEVAGQQIGALVDPRRGACAAFGSSVSVVADTCMMADALTKVVALAPRCGPDWLMQLDAEAFILDRQGVRFCGRPRLSLPRDGRVAA